MNNIENKQMFALMYNPEIARAIRGTGQLYLRGILLELAKIMEDSQKEQTNDKLSH